MSLPPTACSHVARICASGFTFTSIPLFRGRSSEVHCSTCAQKGVVRPAAAPPQHRARGRQRPSDSGDPPPATNADEPREAAQHPARTEPRTQCHPLCTRCRPQHPSGHRCLWTQPPGDTAKQCDYLLPGRGFTGPFTFFFLAFYF